MIDMLPHLSTLDYAIVLPFIFLAGLIDSIAGGGGLISLPAYWSAGLPPHIALGTNKFSSCCGTIVSTSYYFHANMIDIPVALISAAFRALLKSARVLGAPYCGSAKRCWQNCNHCCASAFDRVSAKLRAR